MSQLFLMLNIPNGFYYNFKTEKIIAVYVYLDFGLASSEYIF